MSNIIITAESCTIKIFMRGTGVVDGEGVTAKDASSGVGGGGH